MLLPDLIDGLLDVRSIHAHERGSKDAPVGVEYGGRNQEDRSIALQRFVSPSRCWERDTLKSIGPRELGADAPNVRMPLDDPRSIQYDDQHGWYAIDPVDVRKNTFLRQEPFCRVTPILANAFYVRDVPYRWMRGIRTALETQ